MKSHINMSRLPEYIRLKLKRVLAGRTQSELAHIIGVSKSQFSRYEAGTRDLSEDQLVKLKRELGL